MIGTQPRAAAILGRPGPQRGDVAPLSFPVAYARSLRKAYPGSIVLDDVDFDVEAGEMVLLLGANGAGKSTFLRCLLGIVPFDGEVRIGGLDPRRHGRAARGRIGYLPQSPGLHLDMTVEETLRFYATLRGAGPHRRSESLARSGLQGLGGRRVAELSGGMRQRLGFAVALLGDPPLLLLDEPTASLDTASRALFRDALAAARQRGTAIVLSTHAPGELADLADRTLVLDGGKLLAGQDGGAS